MSAPQGYEYIGRASLRCSSVVNGAQLVWTGCRVRRGRVYHAVISIGLKGYVDAYDTITDPDNNVRLLFGGDTDPLDYEWCSQVYGGYTGVTYYKCSSVTTVSPGIPIGVCMYDGGPGPCGLFAHAIIAAMDDSVVVSLQGSWGTYIVMSYSMGAWRPQSQYDYAEVGFYYPVGPYIYSYIVELYEVGLVGG